MHFGSPARVLALAVLQGITSTWHNSKLFIQLHCNCAAVVSGMQYAEHFMMILCKSSLPQQWACMNARALLYLLLKPCFGTPPPSFSCLHFHLCLKLSAGSTHTYVGSLLKSSCLSCAMMTFFCVLVAASSTSFWVCRAIVVSAG